MGNENYTADYWFGYKSFEMILVFSFCGKAVNVEVSYRQMQKSNCENLKLEHPHWTQEVTEYTFKF